MIAVFNHGHSIVGARNHFHVALSKLIRCRTKLHSHSVRARADLPHEVVVGSRTVDTCSGILVVEIEC